ncbi:Ppx/GppA phosphatase family protein [Roseibium aggregatum]|uniref:Ppx/GppA phosphatase family protein n=1 Tax=Roseibium aggregatum TaxID=187304 RepID=UPI001F21E988|nr:Ppx/GppA phosphatase family protein [Roseibium aggregatum]
MSARNEGDKGPDGATSAKGKKAARRRGRKRRQAANGAVNGRPVHNEFETGVPNGRMASDVQTFSESAKAPAEIRLPTQNGARVAETKPAGRREPSRTARNGSPLYAALDLGTNNCRLLIARPEERGFRVVDAYSRIVRLGEGVGSNRRLSDTAMDRAIDALANCHRKLADRGVARSRLIATEACRAAENGDEFIERVRQETGLALEIVNRETEARLAVAGCASLVDHEADGVILFDIGGGSSEIVWLDLRNRCGARGYALTRFIRSWISLPVGVVNLAERHGGVHVTPDIFEAMVDDASSHLAAFNLSDNLSEAIAGGGVHMLGTSGTVTTLAGVHLGLKRYDRRRVDGTWLDDRDVSRMIDQLRDMPYEARVENPCIGADRADLVLAGCAILEAIRRRWTCSRLRVADRGLREGILTELMAADGVWSTKKNGRRRDRLRQRKRS